MIQGITSNGIITLTASEGMMLKNNNGYSRKVWLGKNDSPDNWKEVDYSEYEEWQAEQDRLMEEELNALPPEDEVPDLDTLEMPE